MPEEMDLEEKDSIETEDEDTEALDASEDEEQNEETNEEEQDNKEKPHKHHKKWYASVWFWVVTAGVALIAAGLVWFFAFYAPDRATQKEETNAEKAVASDWADLASETDTFVETINSADNVTDFNTLSKDADRVLEVVNRSEDRYKNQSTIESTDYQSALEDINAYLLSLQALLDKDYTEITTNDFDSVKEVAAEAKESTDAFQDSADYVKENIGNDFFNTSIKVKEIYDAKVQEDEAASEAEKQAQQEAAQKLAQEQEDVNKTVNGFMDAFVDADKVEIKKFMTASFQAEFDFDRVDSDYYDPTSYRIIDTVKNSESRYYVYGRLTEKQVGGTDQYAYDYNFTVVKDGGSWLIDLDTAPSR